MKTLPSARTGEHSAPLRDSAGDDELPRRHLEQGHGLEPDLRGDGLPEPRQLSGLGRLSRADAAGFCSAAPNPLH